MAAGKKTPIKGLEDLFLDGLKDIYYAEKKIWPAAGFVDRHLS